MLVTKEYRRDRAVTYARKWALSRNPLFIDFTGIGGNCTNFVSQCVLAGSCVMNYTPDFGWYYISADERAPSWSGVDFFYSFMTQDPKYVAVNNGIGPFGRAVARENAQIGDIVQLQNEGGDWYHSLIISAIDGEEILVCAQSNNALDRPLSSYNYANDRFIHIDGVRMSIDDDTCFDILIAGGEESTDG